MAKVRIGSRVTYRGARWIVAGPAPWLGGRMWRVRRRDGKVRTGWTAAVAPEAALTDIEHPAWEIGEAVHVGSIRRHGVITGIEQEDGLTFYEVLYRVEEREGEFGTRYQVQNTGRVTPDVINI